MTRQAEMLEQGLAAKAQHQGDNAGLAERRAQRRLDRYRLLMRKAADGYEVGALAVQNNGWHTDLTTAELMALAHEMLMADRLDIDHIGSLELPPTHHR